MTIKKIALACLLVAGGFSYSMPAWAAPSCSSHQCTDASSKGKCHKKKGSCEKGGSNEKGSSDPHSS